MTPMQLPAASATLKAWNQAGAEEAAREVLPCCGSESWAKALASRRPFTRDDDLLATSDLIWQGLGEDDWRQAFASHPRIGEQHARAATATSLAWSSEEQRAAITKDRAEQAALAKANREYEGKFGRIFIVCASGRTAAELLQILQQRMINSPAEEMLEAAEQQRQITQLRLRRWLGGNT